METISKFIFSVIFTFLLVPLLIVISNPNTVSNSPTRDDVKELVEGRGREAIAIFSIVIAVFSITISQGEGTALSNACLALSASFLIMAFILRDWANLNVLLYQIQEETIKFAALLLFLSLYFLVSVQDSQETLSLILLITVSFAIIHWILTMVIYINAKRKRWNSISEKSRYEWFKERTPCS